MEAASGARTSQKGPVRRHDGNQGNGFCFSLSAQRYPTATEAADPTSMPTSPITALRSRWPLSDSTWYTNPIYARRIMPTPATMRTSLEIPRGFILRSRVRLTDRALTFQRRSPFLFNPLLQSPLLRWAGGAEGLAATEETRRALAHHARRR